MNKSFRPFARDLAIITAVAALLISKWAGAAEPSVAPSNSYRLPGGCVTTTKLVTHRDGQQQLVRHTRCEYTLAQRARLARDGK
jgi:hypothetical protein